MEAEYRFYKREEDDAVWWADTSEKYDGLVLFTFDKKKVYNLFGDFPGKLSREEVTVFCKENPFWESFFRGKLEEIGWKDRGFQGDLSHSEGSL